MIFKKAIETFYCLFQRILILSMCMLNTKVYGSYTGRYSFGAYLSKESFSDYGNNPSDASNDELKFTQRYFLTADRFVGENDFLLDVRDEYNNFKKVQKSNLTLTSSYSVKIKQLSLKKSGDYSGTKSQVGRFSIPEAGSLVIDGVDIGRRTMWNGFSAKYSLFTGLNQSTGVEEGDNGNYSSFANGAYVLVESKTSDWDRYLYSSTSFVQNRYKGDVDREYFFNNSILQTSLNHHFSGLIYQDIRPRVKLKNGSFQYLYSGVNNSKLRIYTNYSDSIQQYRQNGILLNLPASSYVEYGVQHRGSEINNAYYLEKLLKYGKRSTDSKENFEGKIILGFPSDDMDHYTQLIHLKVGNHFDRYEIGPGLKLMKFNLKRELMILGEYYAQKDKATNESNGVFNGEYSYTRFFKNHLLGLFSFQYTYQKNVNIFSFFLNLTYRFGDGGVAPVREGEPPLSE